MKEYIIELSDNENALSVLVKAYNLHELIRCKDCVHWDELTQACNEIDGIFLPNWFCADGERKS